MVSMFRAFFYICLATAVGVARSEPIAFDTALQIATRSSPDIAQQSASVDAARSASIAAGRLPDPKLAVGIENLPVTGPQQWSPTRDFMTMRKIGLMQDIPNRAKRAAESAVASAAIATAEAQRRISILTVRRDTAVAWLNRYYLERRSALFDELERENQLFDQAVRGQFSAGRGMPADLVEPRQEEADLADRRDELSAEILKSRSRLKRWVGAAAEEPLAGEPPQLILDAESLRGHVHEHPDLAVFVPMTQVAQAEVHEAEAGKRPDWGVELDYGRRGSAFSDMISVQFTLDLPLFPKTRQDPQIEAKRQALTRVESERDAMLRDHTQELEADLAEYDVVTRQLARLRQSHLPLAREKVDSRFASYRAGKVDLTAVVAARRELIDQRLKEIELDSKRAEAAAKLYYFYGPGATPDISVVEGSK
jgi:outer membrane protein, heavy metal efflux system